MSAARFLIGIDVGGTFTDLLAFDERERKLLSAKVPSMPGEQWRGVLQALGELGIERQSIRAFVQGTTIATNALLEKKRCTHGFGDHARFSRRARNRQGPQLVGWAVQHKLATPRAARAARPAPRGQ